MKRHIRLVAIAMLAASPAFAQSQSAMNADAARSAAAADRRLNAQYAATMAKLSAPSRTLLRDAQRSWIGFRDRQCVFESSAVKGGSAYSMVQSACLARLTDERTRQLATYGRCQEGDLACPR